ncbi:hypothetical protein DFJ74DRAFT_748608 [Hyaloraphidium curvatum]|nr:hypothetical protein DFJ74DRAFT_748608 [Hyaloraphidium curvatum]
MPPSGDQGSENAMQAAPAEPDRYFDAAESMHNPDTSADEWTSVSETVPGNAVSLAESRLEDGGPRGGEPRAESAAGASEWYTVSSSDPPAGPPLGADDIPSNPMPMLSGANAALDPPEPLVGEDPDDAASMDPNDPLLAPLQERLRARLSETLGALSSRIRSAQRDLAAASKAREEAGVRLYSVLEEQKRVQSSAKDLSDAAERRRREREVADARNEMARERWEAGRTGLAARRKDAAALRAELGALEAGNWRARRELEGVREELRTVQLGNEARGRPPAEDAEVRLRRLDANLREARAKLESRRTDLSARLEQAAAENQRLEAEIGRASADIDVVGFDLGGVTSAYESAVRKLQERNNELAGANASLEAVRAEGAAHDQQLERIRADAEDVAEQRRKLQDALASMETDGAAIADQTVEAERQASELSSELFRARAGVREAERAVEKQQAENAALERATESAIRKVAELKSMLHEMCSVFSGMGSSQHATIAKALNLRLSELAGRCTAVEKLIDLCKTDVGHAVAKVEAAELQLAAARSTQRGVDDRYAERSKELASVQGSLEKAKKAVARSIAEEQKLTKDANRLKEQLERSGELLGPHQATIRDLEAQVAEIRGLLGAHSGEFAHRSRALGQLTKQTDEEVQNLSQCRQEVADREKTCAHLVRQIAREGLFIATSSRNLQRLRITLSKMDSSIWEVQLMKDGKTDSFLTWEARATEALHKLETAATSAHTLLRDITSAHGDARHLLAQLCIARQQWKSRIATCEKLLCGIDPESGCDDLPVLRKEAQEARSQLDREVEQRERLLAELKQAMDSSAQMQVVVKAGVGAKGFERRIAEIRSILRGHEKEWRKLESDISTNFGELEAAKSVLEQHRQDVASKQVQVASLWERRKLVAAEKAQVRSTKTDHVLSLIRMIQRSCLHRLASINGSQS